MLSFAIINTQNISVDADAVPLCLAQGHRQHSLDAMDGKGNLPQHSTADYLINV